MKWRKSPDSLLQAFDHSLPIVDGVERRAMFGYPCAFFRGHMFCGLHQESIIVLLSEARRDELVAEGATVFEPMPAEIVADRQRLRALLSDALAHASSLTPKRAKARAAKKKATQPKRAAVAVKKPKQAAKKATAAKARSTKAAPPKRKAARKTGTKKKRRR